MRAENGFGEDRAINDRSEGMIDFQLNRSYDRSAHAPGLARLSGVRRLLWFSALLGLQNGATGKPGLCACEEQYAGTSRPIVRALAEQLRSGRRHRRRASFDRRGQASCKSGSSSGTRLYSFDRRDHIRLTYVRLCGSAGPLVVLVTRCHNRGFS